MFKWDTQDPILPSLNAPLLDDLAAKQTAFDNEEQKTANHYIKSDGLKLNLAEIKEVAWGQKIRE